MSTNWEGEFLPKQPEYYTIDYSKAISKEAKRLFFWQKKKCTYSRIMTKKIISRKEFLGLEEEERKNSRKATIEDVAKYGEGILQQAAIYSKIFWESNSNWLGFRKEMLENYIGKTG